MAGAPTPNFANRRPRRLPRRGRGDLHAGALERLGAWLEDAEATGTIENTDLMPAALLARFGRVTAEQVVQHVEEHMGSASRRAIMILATIGAREESTHVATAPSRSRRG